MTRSGKSKSPRQCGEGWEGARTDANHLSSVIALSKIYQLNDSRVAQTMVKGDLIVTESNRIMTRSRAKQSESNTTRLCVSCQQLTAASSSRS